MCIKKGRSHALVYKLLSHYSSRCVQSCQIDGAPVWQRRAQEQRFFVNGMGQLELPCMEVVCIGT